MGARHAPKPLFEVELIAVDQLARYARNAKKHPPEQVAQIANSIEEFGWTAPLLADDGELVAGHGRLDAAELIYRRGGTIRLPDGRELPLGTVPVISCSGWSEQQRRAYVLADNKIAEGGSWDEELLRTELLFLEESGEVDFSLTGFSEAELAQLLTGDEGEGGDEWQGMPEFDQQDKKAFRSLALHFKDQAAVDAFAELVGQKITPKTRFLWFPEIEIERYADKRYTAE